MAIYMLQKQVQGPLHCVAHKVALLSSQMFSRLILVALPGDAYPELIHHQASRVTVVDNLPTSVGTNADGTKADFFGPADVGFIGNTLYVLQAGAGCGHGVPSSTNGIYRINSNGSHTMIADLGSWSVAHPGAHNEPDDYTPEGNWYSMTIAENHFYALEPNHGNFVKVGLDGSIELVVDISASEGHIVPTAVASKQDIKQDNENDREDIRQDSKGNFYVGNLGVFPITGISSVFKITPTGNNQKNSHRI